MEGGPHLSMQVPRAPHTLGIRPEAMRPMTDPMLEQQRLQFMLCTGQD